MCEYQHEIADMSDQQGQVKRKQLTFLCQEKRKRKETTTSKGTVVCTHPGKNVKENKY